MATVTITNVETAEKIAAEVSAAFFAYYENGSLDPNIKPDKGDKQLGHLIVWALSEADLLKD
jgi:hypothetical protein